MFLNATDGESSMEDVDCLGWTYEVNFDVYHKDAATFANAPEQAIGVQYSNHEVSTEKKRWVRLTTHGGPPDGAALEA